MKLIDLMTNEERINYRVWGIKANYYHFMGRVFGSVNYLNKAIDFLDKRWDLGVKVLRTYGIL